MNPLQAANHYNRTSAALNNNFESQFNQQIANIANFESMMRGFSNLSVGQLSSLVSSGMSPSVLSELGELRKKLKQTESLAIKTTMDKTSLLDLVSNISEGEVLLQTVMNIRDRAINSYQEIIKMQI